MSETQAGHLPPSQIIEAAAGALRDGAALAHLETCAACQEDLENWRAGLRLFAPLREGNPLRAKGDCPSMEELATYCSGGAEEKSALILEHLGECGRCAAIAAGAVDQDEADVTPALRSRTAAWQREMAERFARQAKPRSSRLWRSGAVAAALIVAVGGAVWWRAHERDSDPAVLLARAYTEARPFEYRLPDGGFGRVSQRRGAGSDRALSLVKAEAEIRERLEAHPGNPDLLALKGRAQLLDGAYEGAIELLTLASEGRPEDPEILSELGTAYALRGGAEKRNIDLGHALDLYQKALKRRPKNERDLYNVALVYEALSMYTEALDEWNTLLRLKIDTGWREEAGKRKAELEAILEKKKKADREIVRDPAAFLAAFGQSREFDPERYHEVAWPDWVGAMVNDPAAAQAARLEASEFQRRFRDPYMNEIVTAAAKRPAGQAVEDLAKAVALNKSGHADAAGEAARQAIAGFHAARVLAGELRAKVELAYSNRFSARLKECAQLTEDVLSASAEHSYPWLTAQAHMEHAGCTELLSNSGAARAEIGEAIRLLSGAGFELLALRARGYVAGLDRISGNYVAIWDNAPAGLAAYWKLGASPYRAQDFEFNMQSSARALGWEDAAVALDRAAVRSLSLAGNAEMETLNRLYLADLLKENREDEEAARELDRARALVRGLKPGPTLDNLKWQAQLGGFEVEMAAGHAGQVIRELDTLTASAGLRSASDQMRFHQIRGLALASAGDWKQAAESFEKAIEWNQRKAASLASYLDRVPVLESAAASYRNLAEIQLVRLHDAKKSLATWLQYQGVSAGEMSRPSLVFAALVTKVVVWKTGMDGVSFRVVDAAPAEVAAACRRFLRLCSTPHSAQSDIKELGGRLAGWLVEPELRNIAERTVYLRTEGWLSSIPFSVLGGSGGHYLGRDRDFVYLAGPDGDAKRDRPVSADSSALVVAAPRANAPEQGQLPVLQATEHEAAEVAEYFRRPVLLTGSAVSVESIGSNSGRSNVFHFSGHGWANGGNGALILPPAPDGSPRFETAREISRQDWRECSLAVLSACLTAAGEERGAVNNQSLVRAMLSAGARRVVAARWSVDSETTRLLMRHFYKRLLSGEPVPSSLVSAGAELAKTSEWEHPYYWAAFDTFATVRDP